MASGTDVFLSHNWGKDESGRDNHERVSLINEELKRLGYQTWFDAERMTGCIAEKISQGIEQTKGVIVFITRRYHEKVNGLDTGDNCQLEFNYASRKKKRSNMVAVLMDKCMCNTNIWTGLVGLHLGGEMYVDMSGDLKNRTYLSKQIKRLQNELQSKEIKPTRGILCSLFYFGEKLQVLVVTELLFKHFEIIILQEPDDIFSLCFLFICFTSSNL